MQNSAQKEFIHNFPSAAVIILIQCKRIRIEGRLINEQLLTLLTNRGFELKRKSKSEKWKYLIIMTRESSSCSTLSKYIISRSDTIAPLITIISSPLIMPDTENNWNSNGYFYLFKTGYNKKTICFEWKRDWFCIKETFVLFANCLGKLVLSFQFFWTRGKKSNTVFLLSLWVEE